MRQDITVGERVMKSYKMMLDFYGMRLVDEKTGEVRRAKNWKSRYLNLNTSGHNNLRISRILASLGHLGFWRWKVAWINFLEEEIYENKVLTHCDHSFEKFWVKLRDIEKPDEEEFIDSKYYKARCLGSNIEEATESDDDCAEDIEEDEEQTVEPTSETESNPDPGPESESESEPDLLNNPTENRDITGSPDPNPESESEPEEQENTVFSQNEEESTNSESIEDAM